MRKDFILEVSEGTPKPYTELGAHLSKANILLVLVMNFGPLSHLKESPKMKDIFYMNFSNSCNTMLRREWYKILLWKFSLS